MGDVRYDRPYARLRDARDRAAALRMMSDEDVVFALAGASRAEDPYLANVIATEASNRIRRGTQRALQNFTHVISEDLKGHRLLIRGCLQLLDAHGSRPLNRKAQRLVHDALAAAEHIDEAIAHLTESTAPTLGDLR